MTTYNFTTNELASKLPLGPAILHTIELIRMQKPLIHQIHIRASRDGAYPRTCRISANMVELLLALDGKITAVQQDGDQVTVTTDTEPEPATIYSRARQTIEAAHQWPSGDAVTIWEGEHSRVFIKEFNGLLSLNAQNGKPGAIERTRCGYLNPADGWHFDLSRANYDRWANRAKQLLSA